MDALSTVDESAVHSIVDAPSDTMRSSATKSDGKKSYLVGLEFLRAIAALSVCLFHYSGGMLPKLIVPGVKYTFSGGYLGVDIFFVISGFIIPYSLVGKNYRVKGFFAYIKKRILRINPPAYASMALVLAQGFIIDRMLNHTSTYTGELSWWQIFHNVLFTIPFTNYKWINGIFWTLAIEFQFYLFIGVLFNFLFNRGVLWFVGIYIAVSLAQFAPFMASVGFFHYSTLFALGGVALLWHQKRIPSWMYIGGLVLFGSLTFWQLGIYATLVGVATAVAINSINVRIPGFSFLGKISYSLYLIHTVVGTTAEFILIKLVAPTTDARKIMLAMVCLIIAICAASVFYWLIEKPFMRLAAQKRS
ncbi:acyltransferase family protein [Hymenobacter terrigena]